MGPRHGQVFAMINDSFFFSPSLSLSPLKRGQHSVPLTVVTLVRKSKMADEAFSAKPSWLRRELTLGRSIA